MITRASKAQEIARALAGVTRPLYRVTAHSKSASSLCSLSELMLNIQFNIICRLSEVTAVDHNFILKVFVLKVIIILL